ncbi:MAG: flagellar basal body P-ring formation protein FlgA [Alphaproteobacteria bacterium]|nr:flagellar basal body P-ring formation protein FlgA [Alphaproteobacteria bacterium]
MRRTFICLAALIAFPCHAATLRPMTSLSGPTVRLSDLFDDAGPNAARILGPGPALGGNIVVEAPQLAAIARQFGVNWRPASPADRAFLDRPGRPLTRDEAMAPVRVALIEAGASENCEVEIPGFTPPQVPLKGGVQTIVTQLQYDAPSGRFSAALSLTGDFMEPVTMRLAGRVQETIEVPIATTRLPAGAVLRAGDVHMARIRAALARDDVAREPQQAIGMALRHSISAGQPLPMADLVRPSIVEKGGAVQMLLNSTGLTVAAQGQALESGAMGERIRVLNPVSRAVLEAEVTGPGQVRVQPDSLPLVAASFTGSGHTRLAAGR